MLALWLFQCSANYTAITSGTVRLLLRWTQFMSRFLIYHSPTAGSGLLLSPAHDYNCVCYLEYQVLITWPLTARILSLLSPSKRPVECLLTMGGRVLLVSSDRCPSLRLPPQRSYSARFLFSTGVKRKVVLWTVDSDLRSLRVFLSAVSSKPPPRACYLFINNIKVNCCIYNKFYYPSSSKSKQYHSRTKCLYSSYLIQVIVHGLNTEISYSISPKELKLR